MINRIEILKNSYPQPISNLAMGIGDIAEVVESNSPGLRVGAFLLRSFQGWVSLGDPNNTWEGELRVELAKVRVLPPGTEIKLTVKFS
jgi:hypothetical protein